MGEHGLREPMSAVVAGANRIDPLVTVGVDQVVAALGLDDLDCFRFLDAHDALTGIIQDIIATARAEAVSGRPEAHDRRD